MRKNLFYVFIAFVYIWSWSIFNVAKANETKVSKEYIETVIGHVIRNIDHMDHKQVLSDDLNRIAHMYAIDILLTFQKHLPTILEGAIVDLRLKADTQYKCSIQGEYKNKECYDDNK